MSFTSTFEPMGGVEPSPLRIVASSVNAPTLFCDTRPSSIWSASHCSLPPVHVKSSAAEPVLPVEIFERIIKELGAEPEVEDIGKRKALLACALVSREFYTMSRIVFCRHIAIMRWDLLEGFVALMRAHPHLLHVVESVYLSGRATRDDAKPSRPSGPLATFPLIFAGRMRRLRKLHICCMHPQWFHAVYRDAAFYNALREFRSVTMLYMRDVTFSSADHFARLLDSLPNLEWFTCADLRWLRHGPPVFYPQRRSTAKLTKLTLNTSVMSVENMRTLHEFFAMPQRGSRIQRLKVGRLELRDIEHLGVAQLIRTTASSLQYLRLNVGAVVDPKESTEDVTAAFLRLDANPNLQVLTLKIHAFYKETYQCGWVAPLLESQSSGQLREVNIHMKIGASTDILTAFLAGISREDCSRIDNFLTQPRMGKLEHVAWHIFDYAAYPVHPAVVFDQITGLFPRLYNRGLLRVYIPVSSYTSPPP